jgi:hypothetical protein
MTRTPALDNRGLRDQAEAKENADPRFLSADPEVAAHRGSPRFQAGNLAPTKSADPRVMDEPAP